jgi:phage tail-like protein
MARRATDPLASFNFMVVIDGIAKAGFSEAAGLNTETNVIEYREGTDAITPRKLPGLTKNSNITLKRGVSLDKDLFTWRKTVLDGDIVRANVSIVLLDEKKTEAVRWNLVEAWPSKYVVPDLKANANEMAIETLEITHEGVTRA